MNKFRKLELALQRKELTPVLQSVGDVYTRLLDLGLSAEANTALALYRELATKQRKIADILDGVDHA